MATTRRLQFVNGQISWMVATIVALSVFGALSFELFVTVSLIGFLIVTELTAPAAVTPRWRTRLWNIIAIGIISVALIVAARILRTAPVEFAVP